MLRFYRLMVLSDSKYDLVGYYLTASGASNAALKRSRALATSDCCVVSEVDVFSDSFTVRPFLRVDGVRRLERP